MRISMNILSLFDGISCGQLALKQNGIKYNNYFASEIDSHAIKVTQSNYSTTIQLGDITKLKGNNLPTIDLLIGGSPCQGFSFSGTQLNFNHPKSKLFFDYVRVLNECNPTYFLLENVNMKSTYKDIITNILKVEPIQINSNLVSAQNRKRLYWTNIPNIAQPRNTDIKLQDILESNVDKSYYLDYSNLDNVKEVIDNKQVGVAFTERRTEEAKRIRKEYREKYGKDFSPRRAKELVARTDNKMNCLTATYSLKEHTLVDLELNYRKLTPVECERLQNIPDNYTNTISNSQRYKCIGNGWTINVIAYILEHLN